MFGPRYFGHRYFGERYFGDGSDLTPASLTYLTSQSITSDLSEYTFDPVSFGAEAPDRDIFVLIHTRRAGAHEVTGVTIGGAASEIVEAGESTNGTTALYRAAVPTGTSGSIVVTLSATALRCAIDVFRGVNVAPTVTQTREATTSTFSTTLDIPAGGVALAGGQGFESSSPTITWTGLTERSDATIEGNSMTHTSASGEFATEQTALAITATPTATLNAPTWVAASFGPNDGNVTLVAEAGSYTLTGGDATLKADRRLVAEAGAYSLTGGDATLRVHRRLTADAGAYTLTGSDATLTYSGTDKVLSAESGSYALTGGDATLRVTRRLVAEAGSYTLAGSDASLRRDWTLNAEAGSYTLTGPDAVLRVSRRLEAEAGSYTLTGFPATLTYSAAPEVEPYVGFGSTITTRAGADPRSSTIRPRSRS